MSVRVWGVKGLAVSREKSDLEILVIQLQLAAHNNTKSEKGTRTVTSAPSNVLAPISKDKNLRGYLTEKKRLTALCVCSVFVCSAARCQGMPLIAIRLNSTPVWFRSLRAPTPPPTPLALRLVWRR